MHGLLAESLMRQRQYGEAWSVTSNRCSPIVLPTMQYADAVGCFR